MKKIIGLLLITTLFNACDDGDITIENINLESVQPKKCSVNNIIYKYKDNESLIFEIKDLTDFNKAFVNEVNTTYETIDNSTVKFLYRTYGGIVSDDNFCGTILSLTPALSQEWIATQGTVEITNTAVKSEDPTTKATKITGYKHAIVFRNLSLQKPDGSSQQYDEFVFGNYTTLPTYTLPFGFNKEDLSVSTCIGDTSLFNISGSEVFRLQFDATTYSELFPTTSVLGTKSALLTDSNLLTYSLFSGAISNEYFCSTTTPATPTRLENWTGLNGIANSSGIIEVVTTELGIQFKHTVLLKKVTLKKGSSDFYLGDSYELGSFITIN